MCTLTYYPLGVNNCIITQNRDEFPGRAALGLVKKNLGSATVLFPQDSTKGGTWVATSDRNQVVCLLNGAFLKHKHRPPYRRSRGLVVLDYFQSASALSFFDTYDLEGIEPFTMVVYDQGKLYEWRWDEKQKHLTVKDPQEKHIWASCTLYPPEHQTKRVAWFKAWQKANSVVDQMAILDFHKHAGDGDPFYDLVMNRMDIVLTTSITSIQIENKSTTMKFMDLIKDKEIEDGLETIQSLHS